jgi:5-methylcytosine-specific restriction endonuclease McrA
MEYVAPIAIDLGASFTGVFSSLYSRQSPDPASWTLGVIVEANKNDLTFLMQTRRQMRHMRRNIKRRKLAKRLVELWLADRWPSDADPKELVACRQFLRGLMNRRGFVHLSLDEKIEPDKIDDHAEALEALGLPFDTQKPSEWLRNIVANPEQAKTELQRGSELYTRRDRRDKRALSDFVRRKLQEADLDTRVKDVVDAVTHIRDCLQEADQSLKSGHKPRHEYFRAIRADLEHQPQGMQLCNMLKMNAEQLANLIGHIGNWNLPALRSYFHDPGRRTSQSLDVDRFRRAWLGYVGRWTLAGEGGERKKHLANYRKKWIALLRNVPEGGPQGTRDALWDLLTTRDPAETIPPFQAQNNRRPPVCQTLILDPDCLDRNYPPGSPGLPAPWRLWAQAFYLADAELRESLDEIAKQDSKAIQRKPPADPGRWRDARLLQRVLERSRERDPYKLRLLVSVEDIEDSRSAAREALERLRRDLGAQHVEKFLSFARTYYEEAREARTGIWIRKEDSLLSLCGTHPPHKRKLLDTLLAQVLSDPENSAITEARIRSVVENKESVSFNDEDPASSRRQHGRRRKILPLLKEFSDLQKTLGGDLRQYYLEAERYPERRRRQRKNDKNPYAEAWEAYSWARAVARRIGSSFGHSQDHVERYANPYSLAQVYQLLYEDIQGFSSTCRACTLENAWRARLADGVARATRLPADSVRPIDGALERLLRAKASRIASAFVDGQWPSDISELHVPILIEENRFEFVEQLAALKNVPRKKREQLEKRAADKKTALEQGWQAKQERIRKSGQGLCPYCGAAVGDDGDYDHIVAQAVTRDIEGYSFDSEANLIYAHRQCNQKKGHSLYTLANLDARYLYTQFGTNQRDEIERQIEEKLNAWLNNTAERRAFHQLEEDTQRAIRHGLFVERLRHAIWRKLSMQNVARVNGTQRWFARQLRHVIETTFEKRYPSVKLSFSIHRVRYEDVAALRETLSRQAQCFSKADPQPVYSHVVDAALVLAVAASNPEVRRDLGLPLDGANLGEFEEAGRAAALLPRRVRIRRLERRPVYRLTRPWHRPLLKDNPIGERFVPIGVDREQNVYVGFSETNRSQLRPSPHARMGCAAFLRTLWPALKTPGCVDPSSPTLLADLASHAARRDGTLWMEVDRRRAFQHLQAHRQDPNDECAKLLDALVYRTQRVDLKQELKFDTGEKSPTRDKLLDKSNFTFKVRLPGLGTHELVLPARKVWEKLLDNQELAPHLGEKLVSRTNDVPDGAIGIDWDALMQRHFPRGSSRSHRRVRQVFALPRLKDASGGMRVRRRSYDGSSVFQLLDVEEGAYRGFARNPSNGRLGFDGEKAQVLEVFSRSPNVTPVTRVAPVQDVIHFDEEAVVKTGDQEAVLREYRIERIALLPGTKPRREIRMIICREGLQAMLGSNMDISSLADTSIELEERQQLAIARILREIFGVGSLGPREKALLMQGWDEQRVFLSWTAGTGAGE